MNTTRREVELEVRTPAGSPTDAVRPALLVARRTTAVTFQIPAAGDWWIAVNGRNDLVKEDVEALSGPGCTLLIQIDDDGLGMECVAMR